MVKQNSSCFEATDRSFVESDRSLAAGDQLFAEGDRSLVEEGQFRPGSVLVSSVVD